MKKFLFFLFLPLVAVGQPRAEFVSFDLREQAEANLRAKNKYYRELSLPEVLDVPVLWLDRQIFVHVDGGVDGVLMVNGRRVGKVRTSPEEFDITRMVTDGGNKIDIEGASACKVWVYSQPKLRVADFWVEAGVDSLYKEGRLRLALVLENGYNFPEELNVGYDIYSPQDKLLHFDNRDVVVRGRGRDTVVFEQPVYGMPANFWTAENPRLHRGMIVVRHGKRITEYIPFKAGFGRTEVVGEKLLRNAGPVDIKAVAYNAEGGVEVCRADLKKLKARGFNTVFADRPQPWWFYDLTDREGFYVFDQPITFGDANDPKLVEDYLYSAQTMFARSRNHVSVAGWSLGAPQGNGYNLYKTYRWLKATGDARPVIYNGAQGEWNSDMPSVQVARPR